jgi:hypothetical protein
MSGANSRIWRCNGTNSPVRWTGADQVPLYKVEGKTLTTSAAMNKNSIDGREGRASAVFTNAK